MASRGGNVLMLMLAGFAGIGISYYTFGTELQKQAKARFEDEHPGSAKQPAVDPSNAQEKLAAAKSSQSSKEAAEQASAQTATQPPPSTKTK